MDELALHPTVKPVQMIEDAIRDVSGRGEIVLDVFGGSGSTPDCSGEDRSEGPTLRARSCLLRDLLHRESSHRIRWYSYTAWLMISGGNRYPW